MSRGWIPPLLLTVLLGWWFWPWLRPGLSEPGSADEAIAVLADDPLRSAHALTLWHQRPQAMLVVLGPAWQQRMVSLQLLALPQEQRPPGRRMAIAAGDDTVGQLTALSRWVGAQPGGPPFRRLVLVTDPPHLRRAAAVARIVLGIHGVRVIPAASPRRPNAVAENPWRLRRDQLRAQLWRASGEDGRRFAAGLCRRARAGGLPFPPLLCP